MKREEERYKVVWLLDSTKGPSEICAHKFKVGIVT